MKNVLNWIKANPISVASFVAILAAVGYLFFGVSSQAQAFRQEVESQNKMTSQITGLMRTSVSIRPLKPGDPAITQTITVNDRAIESLKAFYERIKYEAEAAEDYLLQRNMQFHEELIPGLLSAEQFDGSLRPDFRRLYRQAFLDMLRAPAGPDDATPRLNAGTPPDPTEVQQRMQELAAEFTTPVNPRLGLAQDENEARLAEQRAEELVQAQREHLTNILQSTARRIHIYASLPDPAQPDALPQDFPFQIGAWSDSSYKLENITIENMWDGQMTLWIQQDIVRAIELANGVRQPNTSVLTAPIKRLISIRVLPEFIGISKPRPDLSTTNTPTRPGGAGPGMVDPYRMGPGGMGPGMGLMEPGMMGGMGMYGGLDSGTDSGMDETLDPNQPIKPNFMVSNSGRRSNPLYDVRVAEVRMVVDANQFPVIFDALHAVNFMTVLEMNVKDVDEYEALREGFVYTGDAVEVTMLIESIWLRQWTQPLMPRSIRVWLGIEQAEGAGDTGGDMGGSDF